MAEITPECRKLMLALMIAAEDADARRFHLAKLGIDTSGEDDDEELWEAAIDAALASGIEARRGETA